MDWALFLRYSMEIVYVCVALANVRKWMSVFCEWVSYDRKRNRA